MYFLSSFSDTTKDVDFRRKVADDSRIQGVCHVPLYFWIFFGWDKAVPGCIIVGYVSPILAPSIRGQPQRGPTEEG